MSLSRCVIISRTLSVAAPILSSLAQLQVIVNPLHPHPRHHLLGFPTHCSSSSRFCSLGGGEDAKLESKIGTLELPAGLRGVTLPRHVALILDGNKRWADKRGLDSQAGHDAGLRTLLQVMDLCAKWGIQVATFFLFSSENWRRPRTEINFVMQRFQKMLVDELDNFTRQGIRISTIGNTSLLSDSLQQVLENTKEVTMNNTRTHVIFAISYSGQDDIVQASQSIAMKVKDGLIDPKDVTKSLLQQELETKITATPCPDLLIRTSGELRISNFLLWQLAYSELYFTDKLWPDFGEAEFMEALQSFQQRRRRFGGR